MKSKKYITKLLAYNLWANERVVANLKHMPEKVLKEDVGGSFGSPMKTLKHVIFAQIIWYDRVIDKPFSLPKLGSDLQMLGSALIESSQKWKEVIDTINLSIEDQISYQNSAKKNFSSSLQDIIIHMVNHGTYHRGQLMHFIRECYDGELKGTDYIIFLRN